PADRPAVRPGGGGQVGQPVYRTVLAALDHRAVRRQPALLAGGRLRRLPARPLALRTADLGRRPAARPDAGGGPGGAAAVRAQPVGEPPALAGAGAGP